MIAVDTNILLYDADEKSPFHARAKELLIRLFESGDPVYLTWDTIHAFLRLSTHMSVFATPFPPSVAAGHLQKIIDHPAARLLPPSPESWAILARLVKDFGLRGAVMSDAVTASILEANGIKTIFTNDRDFWKFPALKPVDPFRARK